MKIEGQTVLKWQGRGDRASVVMPQRQVERAVKLFEISGLHHRWFSPDIWTGKTCLQALILETIPATAKGVVEACLRTVALHDQPIKMSTTVTSCLGGDVDDKQDIVSQ